MRQGQHRMAVEDLEEAIRLDPEYTKAYENRAMVYTLLGRDDEAREDVERAVELGGDRGALEREMERLRQER